MRVHATDDAGSAPTFFETKSRPVVVAAHAVTVSAGVRSIALTAPPERSPRSLVVSDELPARTQSPH